MADLMKGITMSKVTVLGDFTVSSFVRDVKAAVKRADGLISTLAAGIKAAKDPLALRKELYTAARAADPDGRVYTAVRKMWSYAAQAAGIKTTAKKAVKAEKKHSELAAFLAKAARAVKSDDAPAAMVAAFYDIMNEFGDE